MPVDVFHHHNGVVHQNADGKYQREKRHAVQREAPRPRGEQRHRQRQNHGGANNGRLTATQCQKHQRHDRSSGK